MENCSVNVENTRVETEKYGREKWKIRRGWQICPGKAASGCHPARLSVT